MKNVAKYLVICALSSSCTDKTNFYEVLPEITFNPVVRDFNRGADAAILPSGISTAFTEGESTLPKSEKFAVWAYSLKYPSKWSDDATSAATVFDAAEASYTDLWTVEGNPVWEAGDKRITFFAASPAGSGYEFDRQSGVIYKDFDIRTGNKDIKFATPVYDLKSDATGGVATMRFSPALCEVEFYAVNSFPENIEVRVKAVEIEGMAYTGTFTQLPSPKWSAGPVGGTFRFADCDVLVDDSLKRLGGPVLLIPQSLDANVKIICDISMSGSTAPDQIFTARRNMEWNVGKKHTYILNISQDMKFANTWESN